MRKKKATDSARCECPTHFFIILLFVASSSLQAWTTPAVNKACGVSGGSNLYNAMIHPYQVGPMAISGFL